MKTLLKSIALLMLLALPITLFAQQPKQPNLFQKGKEHYNQQEFDAAIQSLQKFLNSPAAQGSGKGAPPVPPARKAEAHYLIGMSFMKKSNAEANFYEQAATNFSKAIDFRPQYPAAKLARARAYMELKRFGPAAEDLEAVTENQPGNIEALFQLGMAYSWLNRHNEAIEALKKVVAANPDNAYAHYYLGVAYSKKEEFGMLELHWKKFLQLCPDCPEAAQVRDFLART